jgi:diguanylate cyclase (GGDEF)-like protein
MKVLSVDARKVVRARDFLAVRLGIAQFVAFGILVILIELLPGADRSHETVAFGCATVALLYAGVQFVLPAKPSLLPLFGIASGAYIVIASVATAATGGVYSPVRILLIFSVVYGAWFYETRAAIMVLVGVMLATATPLLYDANALDAQPLGLTIVLSVVLVMAGILMIMGRQELTRLRDAARKEAKRDHLTEVANRRALISYLERHIRGGSDERLGLVFIDLDGFKEINTVLGHAGGDAALKVAAQALLTVARAGDIVARIGGDEFAIVAPGITHEPLCALAERAIAAVHDAAHDEPILAVPGVTFGASAGTAVWPDDASNADGLLRAADLAMLAAKRSGKNRVATALDDRIAAAGAEAELTYGADSLPASRAASQP